MDPSAEFNQDAIAQALHYVALAVRQFNRAVIEFDSEASVVFQPAAFKAEEAAKYIGVSRRTITTMKSQGMVSTTDFGFGPRYLRADLDRIINAKRRPK